MHKKALAKLNLFKYSVIVYIIIIGILLFWLFSRSFLSVTVLPTSAVVTIDNAPINLSSQGKASKIISSGNHTIKVEADGYSGKLIDKKFWPGITGNIKIELTESPSPVRIADMASHLYPGKNNNEILYLSDNGRTLFKTTLSIDDNNNITHNTMPITDARLSGIEEIIWSPDRDLALFRKNDGVYLFDFQKYDFIHQTETLWSKNVGSVAWAPDSSKIAYYNNDEKTLIFTNSANNNQIRIANLGYIGIENPLLRWSPDSHWLLIVPRNQNRLLNKIYLLNPYSRSLSEVTDTGSQLDAAFSDDNQKIIYTTFTADEGGAGDFVTSIMDQNGSNKKTLPIKLQVSDIVWQKDNERVLVVMFDPISSYDTVYSFGLNEKSLGASIFQTNGRVTSIFRCNSKKDTNETIAYHADGSIYAVNIKDADQP